MRRGVLLNEHFADDGESEFREICALSVSGLARYRLGRVRHWVKAKNPKEDWV
jgi:hypothetical protein